MQQLRHVCIFSLLFFSQVTYAEHDASHEDSNVITGAGAHFTWIFDNSSNVKAITIKHKLLPLNFAYNKQ